MKLSCSAYQAGSCTYAQKILSGHGHVQNYGATSSTATANPTGESTHGLTMPSWKVEEIEGKGSPNDNSESLNEGSSSFSGGQKVEEASRHTSISSHSDGAPGHSDSTGKTQDSSRSPSQSPAHRIGLENRSRSKSVGEQQWTNLRAVMAWYARLRRIKRSKSNQRWMKLRTTVQLSGAITHTVQKKATLKREDSFLKRFSTRQVPEAQDTFEIGEDDGSGGGGGSQSKYRRKKKRSLPWSVVNPDGNFYFYWLFLLTVCVLHNLWTLIVRESFPELQLDYRAFWITADAFTDIVIFLDLAVQFRTGYLEQGLMVYKTKKLANHYAGSKHFWFDVLSLLPTDLLQLYFGTHPMFRIPRFMKTYRMYNYYYIVESRTVYPNVWRVVNLIHILLLLAHWFGCFYYLLSEAEEFEGPWVYPHPRENPSFAPLIRKYLASLYWSTLTLTTIGDLPAPCSNWQYLFTIVSYLIGVFIFATIVGQVGNVITNRNANRLEFERLLDGAKMYMRHHRVPRDMQRRVLRWYDYSWSRGRIQGGGDINTALGLLPDKLKTELALHVNLSVLKKVTIFQECQPEFLHDLVLKMKAYIFTPGDLICRKGEVAREMFIIADGILEVISETGRVLTTMQAGDFFGEIGILNLDGLNKRTADVRSVGYSELFSLSREDVLAAMKDYPEAQDILQTLGRKRLMEARKASAPVKRSEKKSPLTLLGQSFVKGPDDTGIGGEPTTGKRIVEKLRSDVKGLRNAIRKSRKSNSSKEDSSEPESSGKDKVDSGNRRKESTVSVQQYFGGASIVGSMIPAGAAGRGVLKRMHNIVMSDEMEKIGIGGDTSMSNVSPTILPKRVHMQLPHGDEYPIPSGSRSGSASGDREVIGAGLPLIQRLRLLKQKEEKERQAQTQQRNEEDDKPVLLPKGLTPAVDLESSIKPQVPPIPEKSTFQTQVAVETHPQKRIRLGSAESSQPLPTTVLPTTAYQSTSRPNSFRSRDPRGDSNVSQAADFDNCSGMMKPAEPADEPRVSREPRPSALGFQKKDPKNYGSVDDLSPEFSRLPFIKKLKILNERQKIAELVVTKTSAMGMLTRSTSEGSSEIPHSVPPESENLYSVVLGRRTQSSSEPSRQVQSHPRPPFQLPLPSPSSSSSSSPETKEKESGAKGLNIQPLEEEPIRIRPEQTHPTAGVSGETSPQASPPYSPESNETPERRHLKSILKTLAKTEKEMAAAESTIKTHEPARYLNLEEEVQLLKEPTIAGYAARHRKFKNVTFQRQAAVVSPGDGDIVMGVVHLESGQGVGTDKGPEVGLEPTIDQFHGLPVPLELMLHVKKEMEESLDCPGGLPPQQHVGLAVAQEECIGSVFLGIKNIIQTRMEEFQLRFQDRFSSLEKEVRQRDEIISLLQLRIQELEEKGGISNDPRTLSSLPARRTVLGNDTRLNILENHNDGDSYDEDEDDDDEGRNDRPRVHRRRNNHPPHSSYFFSRGDSIDTVIDNTEGYDDDDEVFMEARDYSERGSQLLPGSQGNAQWTVAERESIEMTEFGDPSIPMWQLEFHRETTDRPVNLDLPLTLTPLLSSKSSDTVAVDIGNTSTEYESTSSSEEEQQHVGDQYLTTAPPQQLEDEEEEVAEEEGRAMSGSSDSDEFDNQNWEVQMLAKEMTKREEEQAASETTELDDIVVDEMLELDTEIQEMRDVVNSGALSPTDLDMLESMLVSRTERVQALCKAYSVDDTGRPIASSSSTTTLSTSAGRMGDFRHRSSVQYTHLPYTSFQRRGSKQWNPDEKRGSEADPGYRKQPKVCRQSSLCETGFPAKLASSPYLTKRRESASSVGLQKLSTPTKAIASSSAPTAGKSFLSRFNFMRSLSRTFLYHSESSATCVGHGESGHETDTQLTQCLPEVHLAESPPYSVSSPIQIRAPTVTESSFITKGNSPSPRILTSSIRSDSGTSHSDPTGSLPENSSPIFTIPSTSITLDEESSRTKDSVSHPPPTTGESQPLLKK